MALFAAVSLYAADLNIYASGLKVTQVDNTVTIKYVLNAPADSLRLMLYGEDINSALFMTETDSAALTKGAHQLVKTLPTDIPAGIYHWAIGAYAAANDSTVRVLPDTASTYAVPRGLDVDKDPESPSFGNIYVADALGSVEDGKVLFYPASMDDIVMLTTSGWSGSMASPMRVSVGEDHLLYVTDWSDNEPNIHIVDPQRPTAGEQLVFGGTKTSGGIFVDANNNPIHGSMSHCYVAGKGASRVLYTFDEDLAGGVNPMGVFRYDIGELKSLWTTVPSDTVYDNADHFEQNGNSVIAPDGKGGWWISQYRATDNATIPMLIHINEAGVVNFNSAGTFSAYNRGGLALNVDKTQLASPAQGKIDVYNITWNDSVVPALTLAYSVATVASATSCYNVAFDYAGNLYATYDGQDIYAIAPAKANNSCVTPAPSDSKVYIGVPMPVQQLYLIGDNTGWNPTQGAEFIKSTDNVFEGIFTFTADTSYFALFDALAEDNDNGGWDYVNAHRYAGATDGFLLNHTAWKDTLVKANQAFRIAPAGQYKIRADFNANKITVFYDAPAAIPDNALYISFADVPGKEGGDNGTAITSIADIIESGEDLISAIPLASKIYNAREGCGVKFGTGSAKGELTLTLANAVIPEKIIVNAVAYSATEGSAVLLGDTVNLAAAGNKVLCPYTKTYDGQTAISELTFSTTAKRMFLLDVIIIPAENVEPFAYKIKHPWDLNNIDPWIWKTCEEQADGTWALEDLYWGTGCDIEPAVLNTNWIASPVLVGNPYNGDSCRFVINPAATDVAGILTITKLGDPNPDTTQVVVYDHLYEIGANQGWKPDAGVEMTKKADNVFEGDFTFTGSSDSGYDYFGFITELNASWDVVNQHRFGPASDGVIVEIGDNAMFENKGAGYSFKIAAGSYTFTVDINTMKLTIAPITGIKNVEGESNVQKVLRNGQIFIIRDGETYTVTGAKVE